MQSNHHISLTHVRPFGFKERGFKRSLLLIALLVIVLLIAIFFTLVVGSLPTIKAFGFSFAYNRTWDPVAGQFGALPFLAGTLLISFLALVISTPFSLAVALFLGEYYKRGVISGIFKNIIDLLAAIPSVIYGFWGLFVMVPVVRVLEMKMGILPYGVGIFSASVILAVMIMPYAISLSRQVIQLVPEELKEAAYSLGATRYEVITKIIIPHTMSGLFAGILLSLGRALGETMAVTMLIGNTVAIPTGIFAPGNTMASVIANEFTEATGKLYTSALIEMGLLLFIVVTIINMIGRKVIRHLSFDEYKDVKK
ncbi:MAG TPA: phosphate ABC transporter permease subunit PstC [Chitinophagaceae bacterium]|nr:phosphate ABC transporter permease subunit PstC [Chitinophagaceae bacterium]